MLRAFPPSEVTWSVEWCLCLFACVLLFFERQGSYREARGRKHKKRILVLAHGGEVREVGLRTENN